MYSLSLFVVACSLLVLSHAQQVKQCSCDEGKKCLGDLKVLAEGCIESCWGEVRPITNNPAALRKCFNDKGSNIEGFVKCFVDGMQGCAAGGAQIPKQDFDHIITAAEDRIRKTAEKTLNDLGSENKATVQPVIDVAEKFGACYKTCIRQKITNDFCLSTHKCQPLMPGEKKAKQIMHSCMAKQDLKHHSGDVCDCALAAGVVQLATYCPVLDLLEHKAIPPPPAA